MPHAAGVRAQGHCIDIMSTHQCLCGLPALALHVRPSSSSKQTWRTVHELWGACPTYPCRCGSMPCTCQTKTPKHLWLAPWAARTLTAGPSRRVQRARAVGLCLQEFVAPPLDELSDERAAEVLREVFGHQGFRGLQLEVVRRVLQGTSTLAILPTGGDQHTMLLLWALS